MNLREKIEFLMQRDRIKTKAELSRCLDIPYKTIDNIMHRDSFENVKFDTLEKLCSFFDVELPYLIKDSITDPNYGKSTRMSVGEPYTPTHRIPILGRIAAGAPIYADEHVEGYTYTELNGNAEYFALRVSGDSMNAARIFDGDLIIVRRQNIVEDGQIAVVLVDDEDATVKRFTRADDVVTLVPQSFDPTYQPQIYNLKSHKIDVLGLVIEVKYRLN